MTWMEKAGVRLEASMRQIQDHVNTFEDYTGPVRSHWPQLAQDLADQLLAGEPIDMDQALRKRHAPD